MHDDMHSSARLPDTDHRWLRAYGLQVVLAIGLFVTAVLVARVYHLPVRDPDDSIVGPSYVRLPLIAVTCFLVDVAVRSLRGDGGLVGWWSRVHTVVDERWSASRLRLVLIGMISWYLAYVGFRNLKSYVPFVRPDMLDADLLRLDRALALGRDPAAVLHDVMGTGVAAHLMSTTYVAWIVFLTLSLVIALFWSSNIATGCWYVTAIAINWVLGVAIYYLVPSTGPIYARPELFADLPQTQVTYIARSWMADRTDMLADPYGTDALQTVAAFSSLHVSVMVTALLVAMMIKLRPLWIQWGLWVFMVLNVLATVYLGWHYLLDVFGGVAIGVVAVWTAAWGTGNAHRLPSLIPARHEQANALTFLAGEATVGAKGLTQPERERFWTWPTVVTVLRTVGALAMVAVAFRDDSWAFLLAGLAIYWAGDILDGWLARRLDQETRSGAIADIVCDRLSAVPLYVALVWMDTTFALPVAVYVLEFAVVDLLLSLGFLAWPLMSPNYFYLVDHRLWALNWSPLGKSINSVAFLAILFVTRDALLATVFALALLTLKSLSLARLLRLARPTTFGHDHRMHDRSAAPARTGSG